MAGTTTNAAHLIDAAAIEPLNVLGPTVRILTPAGVDDDAPCAILGSIPPGGVIPLHSHADPETFLALSGEVEGLSLSPDGAEWVRFGPEDVFHVPDDAPHAWRNPGPEPAVSLIVTRARIGRFFREVAASDDQSSPAALQRFNEIAERFGYWNATPEENAEVGIELPVA
jgi:quercetin dioxygenase-like cupin family protein